MSILPRAAQPLLHSFAGGFTRPTFTRFLTLMLGAVLTTGRRASAHLSVSIKGLRESGLWEQGRILGFSGFWKLLWKHSVCRSFRPSPRTDAGDRSLFRGFYPIP